MKSFMLSKAAVDQKYSKNSNIVKVMFSTLRDGKAEFSAANTTFFSVSHDPSKIILTC